MSNGLSEVEGGVDVRIFVGAPLAAVQDAVNKLAAAMNISETDPQLKLDAVIQVTKNWWFAQVIAQAQKEIDAAAQAAEEQIRAAGQAALDSSPLRGA